MKRLYLETAGDGRWEISVADSALSRLRGLLGTRSLGQQRGLLLRGCRSIHMIGMLYALDIIYLDRDGTIVKIVEDLPPFGLSLCWQARDVLEVNSGAVRQNGWRVGERLCFMPAG